MARNPHVVLGTHNKTRAARSDGSIAIFVWFLQLSLLMGWRLSTCMLGLLSLPLAPAVQPKKQVKCREPAVTAMQPVGPFRHTNANHRLAPHPGDLKKDSELLIKVTASTLKRWAR